MSLAAVFDKFSRAASAPSEWTSSRLARLERRPQLLIAHALGLIPLMLLWAGPKGPLSWILSAALFWILSRAALALRPPFERSTHFVFELALLLPLCSVASLGAPAWLGARALSLSGSPLNHPWIEPASRWIPLAAALTAAALHSVSFAPALLDALLTVIGAGLAFLIWARLSEPSNR